MSRGLLGFTAATVAASPACSLPPLTLAPCNGIGATTTQCVDSLTVANTLRTQTQIGTTLLLLGSGGQDPTHEAALCVNAGARVAGVSEHGELRVGGPSCMGGPLSVTNVYGPTTVSNPNPATAFVPSLTVQGGAATDTLAASGAVTAASVAAASSLTVAAYDASPMAFPNMLATLGTAVVQVLKKPSGTDPDPGYAPQTAFAVANPNTGGSGTPFVFVTTQALYTPVGSSVEKLAVGDDVSLIVTQATTVYEGIVVAVCGQANIALVAPKSSGPTFLPTAIPLLAADDVLDADCPPGGTPISVTHIDPVTGAIGYHQGVVSTSSASLLDTYTSLVVSVPPQPSSLSGGVLSDSDMGGPVFMLVPTTSRVLVQEPRTAITLRVVAMLQHGSYNSPLVFGVTSTSPGQVALLTSAGGCKARVIKFVTDTFFAGTGSPSPTGFNLPLPYDSTGLVRTVGLSALQRGKSGNTLPSGGVTSTIGPAIVPPSTQFMSLVSTPLLGGTYVGARYLGAFGQNFPSLPDTALAFWSATGEDTTTKLVSSSSSSSSVTSVASPFSNGAWYNTGLSPVQIATSSAVGILPSTVFEPATQNVNTSGTEYGSMDSLTFTYTVSASPASQLMNLSFGPYAQQTSGGYYNFMLHYVGTFSDVNTYINGLPEVAVAWGGDRPTPTGNPKIVALAGIKAGKLVFATASGTALPYVALTFSTGSSPLATVQLSYADSSTSPTVSVATAAGNSSSLTSVLSLDSLGFAPLNLNSFSFFLQPTGLSAGIAPQVGVLSTHNYNAITPNTPQAVLVTTSTSATPVTFPGSIY